jgi:hypothetical protein
MAKSGMAARLLANFAKRDVNLVNLLFCITFVHHKTALLIHERQKPALFFILPCANRIRGVRMSRRRFRSRVCKCAGKTFGVSVRR